MDTRTQAIILKRTNYGEFDRIVQCITPDGKKSFMARGVRKEKSKLAGGIELFSLSDITIHAGKGDLGTLTSARMVDFYSHILENYDNLQFAYEALKLVSRSSENIDNPDFFSIIYQTLQALNISVNVQLIQIWFYLRMATATGTELNFSVDTNGEKLQASQTYIYDVALEALKPEPKGDISASHIKLLRLLVSVPLKTALNVQNTEELLPSIFPIAKALIKM